MRAWIVTLLLCRRVYRAERLRQFRAELLERIRMGFVGEDLNDRRIASKQSGYFPGFELPLIAKDEGGNITTVCHLHLNAAAP